MSIKNGWHFDDFHKRYYRNEDGSRIPEEQCLCFAHEPSECCCDCTSWDNYREDTTPDYDMDYLDNTDLWRTNDYETD